jgi:hypothetical protein
MEQFSFLTDVFSPARAASSKKPIASPNTIPITPKGESEYKIDEFSTNLPRNAVSLSSDLRSAHLPTSSSKVVGAFSALRSTPLASSTACLDKLFRSKYEHVRDFVIHECLQAERKHSSSAGAIDIDSRFLLMSSQLCAHGRMYKFHYAFQICTVILTVH